MNAQLVRLLGRRSCWLWPFFLLLVAALASLPGCSDPGDPAGPKTGDVAATDANLTDSGVADSSLTDSGVADSGGDSGAGSALPPAKPAVVLSELTAPSAAERAQWKQDLKDGKTFDALRLRPDAVLVAQAACDAAVVAKDELRFPLAGNEALLQVKPGAALVGQRANPGQIPPGGNNVFGFLRVAKAIKQEGGQIVIATAKARLQDAVLGAAQIGDFAPGPQTWMDLEALDLSPFLGPKANQRRNQARERRKRAAQAEQGRFGTQRGALEIADFDETYALHGLGDSFSLTVAEVAKSMKVTSKGKKVDVSISGDAKLVGQLEFRPTFRGAVEIEVTGDWWPPNKWVEVRVDHAEVSAKVESKLEAGLELDVEVEVGKGEPPDDEANDAAAADPAKSGDQEFDLADFSFKGPMLGPIPTSFHVEIVAECAMSAYGNVQATVAGGVDFAGQLGLAYDGDDWAPINSLKYGKRYSLQVALGGGVKAECSVGPEVTWLIADTAGPSLTAAAYIEGTLDYASECPPPDTIGQLTQPDGTFTKSVEAGLKIVLGIAVEFLGVELGYEEELAKKAWPLYEDSDEVPGVGLCQSDCSNGVQDNAETDVDCGGAPASNKLPLCPGCGNGKACVHALDCAGKNACLGGKCTEINCKDGKQGPGELGVDCGEKCGAGCKLGNACVVSGDCASNNCVGSVCSEASCSNGVQDNAEPGLDCGGPCAKCQGAASCHSDAECESGICLPYSPKIADKNGFCAPPGCSLLQWKALYDGQLSSDLGETAVDCGGPCAKGPLPDNVCKGGLCGLKAARCGAAQACAAASDCQSGNCAGGTCGPTLCFDGVQDGDESGVDCGGGCTKRCGDGQGCANHQDCGSGLKCLDKGGQKLCGAACSDGVADFGESDVDCGLVCSAKCGTGKKCLLQGDCAVGHTCTHVLGDGDYCMKTCSNGELDPGEAEVDCGGGCPTKCAYGKSCSLDKDCASGSCGVWKGGKAVGALTCSMPCENGRWDPKEPDLDCGAVCGKKWCTEGKKCFTSADCATDYCTPTKICGYPSCLDGWHNGKESDVDCGAACGNNKCKKGQKCGSDADCLLGKCDGGVCIGDPCANGKQDSDESDVDCGGGTAPYLCYPCKTGQKCAQDKDCKSNQCQGGKCIYEPCSDKIQSPGEADVDCGGICAAGGKKCAFDQKCKKGSDCQSGFCNGHHCVKSACDNQVQDAGESDVDCGGPCAKKCAEKQACKAGSDCASAACGALSHLCVASGCVDQAKSGTETGVDCGGPCSQKCADKQGCKSGGDCQSQVCNGAVCVAGTCWDKLKNGSETDIDCGGSCAAKCSTGKGCAGGGDCASGICSKAGVCVLSTCDDGALSSGESGVDCGGSCKTPCLLGQGCKVGGDCASGFCSAASGLCVGSACGDGVKNGDETGVDCGGSCKKCLGAYCWAASQCASGYCSAKTSVCVAGSCEDGSLSGDEVDVDCGGSCAAKCAVGQKCSGDSGCASGFCAATDKKCVATACQNQVKDGQEVGVDCGGSCGGCGKGVACSDDSVCKVGLPCVEASPGGAKFCGCPLGMDVVAGATSQSVALSCAWDIPVWGIEEPSPYNTFDNGVIWEDKKGSILYGTYMTTLDTRTGLEWLGMVDVPSGGRLVCPAEASANFLNGKGGWRTPTRQELLSITDWTTWPVLMSPSYIALGQTPQQAQLYSATPYPGPLAPGQSPDKLAMQMSSMATGSTPWTRIPGEGYPCVRSTKTFSAPAERWKVESDDAAGEVVLDQLTGLLWQRKVAEVPVIYADAEKACATLGGLWRVPKIREIASLMVLGKGPVHVDTAAFPATPPGPYWGVSAKLLSKDSFNMLLVDFASGDVYRETGGPSAAWMATKKNLVRCVK